MERRQDTFVEANARVAGLQVQKDWLKQRPDIEDYRACLHGAFERAQIKYKQRRQRHSLVKEDFKQKLETIENKNSSYYTNLKTIYQQEDPVLPNMASERMKLTKIGRNCSKKFIERYFNIDQETDQMVYYKKENDEKPKKSVALDACKIEVESFRKHSGLAMSMKTAKVTLWVEEDKPYRVEIRLKNRKYQPAYIYTESLHQATCIKANIEYLLKSTEVQEMSDLITRASQNFKILQFKAALSKLYQLKLRRLHLQKTQLQFQVIEQAFTSQRVEVTNFIMSEIERMKMLEYESPVKEEFIPEIWSTLRRGQVRKFSFFIFKIYQQVARKCAEASLFTKQRRQERHPVIQDLIKQKMQDKHFTLTGGSYRVHEAVLDNMSKIGDIPYLISDINSISQVKLEGETLILYDKKKHEYHIPISEICYIATDIGYTQNQQNWRLQMRGRKINQNVENIGENIFPSQLGLERFKPTRLKTDKTVLKVSIKSVQIPHLFQDQLKKYIHHQQDKIMFRFKIEIGEFCAYTTLFQISQGQIKIELKEDLTLDISDAKHIKLSLIGIKGRVLPHNQIINELVNEQIISYVSIRVRDLEQSQDQMIHEIGMDRQFYNPKDVASSPKKPENIIVTAALVIQQVLGGQATVDMEGNQLLIGRYCIYKRLVVAKVLKLNRNSTVTIQIVDDQPKAKDFSQRTIENVNIKQDITLIERYGVSVFNINQAPPNYQNGQFEWSLDFNLQTNELAFLSRLQYLIQSYQIKQMYQQRQHGFVKKAKNQTFVCGRLQIAIMSAQNLANPDKVPSDSFVQISVQDTKKQSSAKFIDIANEQSFIMCKKNSEEVIHKTYKTTVVRQNNNPTWVSNTNPQGEIFELGMFMKKYPHFLLIEVYHQKKKGVFSSEKNNELIGFAEIATEDLIQIDNYGQEFYIFLEDSLNRSSLVKLRTLFVPTPGTIDRLNLDMRKVLFKNAQQYLFYKILHLHQVFDEYGYRVPLGKYLIDFHNDDEALLNMLNKVTTTSVNYSLLQDVAQFSVRYEKFSPEHKKHKALKESNPYRPKFEENVYYFKQLWLYTQFVNRNKALNERQKVFWEEYMAELAEKGGDEGAQMDDELRSIRSKLTNTTKMISSKYKRRSLAHKTQNPQMKQQEQEGDKRVGKFSAMFIGQWEKEKSWKYVDIWYLVKFGIPSDMRTALWKDLLRRQINEQQVHVYFFKSAEYRESYNPGLTLYDNLKLVASSRDSIFNEQIESDIREYAFPLEYLRNQPTTRDVKIEEERCQMFEILRAYGLWANEFCIKRKKVFVYHQGLLSILQRILTFMSEEDAFWSLVGMVKAFSNVLTNDFKESEDKSKQGIDQEVKLNQYQNFSPLLSRRTLFKNEMNILKSLIKLHFPLVHEHLKALGAPLEYYFYDSFSQFFTNSFSSEIVLRLWDMIVFNLSTNSQELRKRALWYLLAIPLYMIQVNLDAIMKSQNPIQVRVLLTDKTAAFNYNPNLFIDELLVIIRQVFVIKETMMNRLLRNDMSYQLENIRKQVERDFVTSSGESLARGKELAKHLVGKGAQLRVNTDRLQELIVQQDIALTFKIVGFRNLLDHQKEQELVQFSLQVQCDESVATEPFNIAVPNSIEQAYLQILPQAIELKTKVQYTQGKKLQLKLVQITNGIHQLTKGVAQLNIEQLLDCSLEQDLCLKLQNEGRNVSYIDLKIQVRLGRGQQASSTLGKLSLINNETLNWDNFTREKDDEVKRQLKPDQLKDWAADLLQKQKIVGSLDLLIRVDKENKEVNLREINQLIIGAQNIQEEVDLQKEENQTQLLLKLISHGQNQNLRDLCYQLFLIFSSKVLQQRMPLTVFSQLINHLYSAISYPIPLQECSTMVTLLATEQNSFISRVTQSLISDNSIQEIGLFDKFFKASQQTTSSYDVSGQFKSTLNSVLRLTGLSHTLDFNIAPFNSINFWLKNSFIRKVPQILNVTLCQRNGDQILFRFRFDNNGLFQTSPSTHQFLPLHLNGSKVLSQDEFHALFNKLPLLSACYRQEIFLRDQIFGSQETYVDASVLYKVSFQAINNKRFVFHFDPRIEKQDDFTMDPSQMMRLAKGDISQIYKKKKEENGTELYQVNLAALSKQDTFITIKRRVKQTLDFIIQSENLRESVPNVLSQKFQFKRPQPKGDQLYYNSMSRICNETSQKETQFELVRVQDQLDDKEDLDYSSFGLYHHPNGVKEWRACKIIMKVPGSEERYRIQFLHEREEKISYVYNREDILLSFDFKRNQETYYKEEIQELLDKLDEEEFEIAEMLNDQDKKGMNGGLDDIKKQLQYGEEQGLRIGHQQLDEEMDPEVRDVIDQLNLDDQ